MAPTAGATRNVSVHIIVNNIARKNRMVLSIWLRRGRGEGNLLFLIIYILFIFVNINNMAKNKDILQYDKI
jgi:hypothetical protein